MSIEVEKEENGIRYILSSNRSLFFGIRLYGFKRTFSQSNGFTHSSPNTLYKSSSLICKLSSSPGCGKL